MEMEKIGEAILDKVKIDAEKIVNDAEEKALEEIEKAMKQQEARLSVEKEKIMGEANTEATKIISYPYSFLLDKYNYSVATGTDLRFLNLNGE